MNLEPNKTLAVKTQARLYRFVSCPLCSPLPIAHRAGYPDRGRAQGGGARLDRLVRLSGNWACASRLFGCVDHRYEILFHGLPSLR